MIEKMITSKAVIAKVIADLGLEENDIKISINTITQTEAPIQKGQKMGTLSITMKDEVIENVDIICKEKIEKKKWIDYLKQNLQDMFKIHILNL